MGDGKTRKVIVALIAIALLAIAAVNLLMDAPERAELEIEDGHFMVKRFGLDIASTVSYEVEVTSGGSIDVFLYDKEGYQAYLDGVVVGEGSIMDISATEKELTLDEGEYYLVIDNTDRGDAFPSGDVVVSCTTSIQASRSAFLLSPLGMIGIAGLLLSPLEVRFLWERIRRLTVRSGDEHHRSL